MGKVKFGLSAFEYGKVVNDLVEGSTRKVPGLDTANINITNELVTVMADDGPYVVVSGGITDLSLELGIYDLNSDARKDFYGITVENGVEKYNKNLTPNDIACLFRTRMEDGKSVWFGLLKGKFSVPGASLSTKSGAPAPTSDSTTGQFVARGDAEDGDMLYIGREDNPDFDLDAFKTMVFPKSETEGAAQGASVMSLSNEDYSTKTNEELKALLDEKGIAYKAADTKDVLISLLNGE